LEINIKNINKTIYYKMAYNFSEGATISKIVLIFMSIGLYFVYNDESNNSDSVRQNGGKGKGKQKTRKNKY
jgi:hypothetical protein